MPGDMEAANAAMASMSSGLSLRSDTSESEGNLDRARQAARRRCALQCAAKLLYYQPNEDVYRTEEAAEVVQV